jgi:hypothetical protein
LSPTPRQLVEGLAAHPHRAAICTRVSAVVLAAAAARRPACLSGTEVLELQATPPLSHEESATAWGDVLKLLDRDAQSRDDWALLAACTALYVGSTSSQLAIEQVISDLAWLSAHTPCNPWLYIDAGLGEQAADFWSRVGEGLPALPTAEQLSVVSGLIAAQSHPALALKQRLLAQTANPTLVQLLETSSPVPGLSGELDRGPRAAWSLVLQALFGWLFVAALGRGVARYVLFARTQASVDIDARGLYITQQRRVLGQELGQQRTWLALDEIAQLTRETRFVGAGIYAGLVMLALGTYCGVQLWVTGVRTPGGAPSLIWMGALVVLGGVVGDLLLGRISRFRSGKTRIVVVPRKGRSFALGPVPLAEADAWLAQLGVLRALGSTLR